MEQPASVDHWLGQFANENLVTFLARVPPFTLMSWPPGVFMMVCY